MAERELNERTDGQPKVSASTPTDKPAAAPGHRHQARPHPDSRSRAPSIRTRHPIAGPTPERPRRAFAGRVDDRLRLARDLHDGVQAERVSLLIRLERAEEDPATPPPIARTLASLGDHTTAALASVREVALGIYPPALAGFGVAEALRALAGRASTTVIVSGTAPRSSDEAEAAVYFSCSEAIQDVAKHAGRAARVTLSPHHDTTLGGAVQLDSHPGRGTVLTLSLPWPCRQQNTDPSHRHQRHLGQFGVSMLMLVAAGGSILLRPGQTIVAAMAVAAGLTASALVLGPTNRLRRHRAPAPGTLWRPAARAGPWRRGLSRAGIPAPSRMRSTAAKKSPHATRPVSGHD